jgi:xanthine/uracil permease
MGLFHATKKRVIVSWSVTLGVAAIVAAVKKLPYPWRNIVDAGVVVGLTWGSVSIILNYFKALITGITPADPALPTA